MEIKMAERTDVQSIIDRNSLKKFFRHKKTPRLPANVYMIRGINRKHFSSIDLLKLK